MGIKGFIFSLDALISISIITIAVTGILMMQMSRSSPILIAENLHSISEDGLSILSNCNLSDCVSDEILNEYRKYLSKDDLNKPVIDFIAKLWIINVSAEPVIKDALKIFPESIGYELSIDDQKLYSRGKESEIKISASRIASGYEEGKEMKAYSSRALIRRIDSKLSSKYIYFGGFEGQGNITKYFDLDNAIDAYSIYIEAFAGSDFHIYVNGKNCGIFSSSNDVKNLTIADPACLNFNSGKNNISLIFTGTLEESYIGGGYIRIDYKTPDIYIQKNHTKFYIPQTSGIINYYSSLFVPGKIKSMAGHFEIYNNQKTFINIGGKRILNNSGSNNVQIVELSNEQLKNILNYSEISSENVPIRIGTEGYEISIGNADVILITDLSGSMDYRMNSEQIGIDRNCNDPNLYNNDTKRVSLAKCLDKEFVSNILSIPGNRIGLSAFYGDESPPYKGRVIYHDLSNNISSLFSHIDTYWPRGGTCICCAINDAYKILSEQSNSSRQKFIIVMSDGIPTHTCGSMGIKITCDGTRTGLKSDEGLWLGNGQPEGARCYGGLDDCNKTNCQCASQNANWSASRAYTQLNSTVYSIGFGPVSECPMANNTLNNIAESGKGKYYHSMNGTELKSIYSIISQEITLLSYNAQIIENYTQYSNISGYLNIEYEPDIAFEHNQIEISGETERFSCNKTFFIPLNLTKMSLAAYSGSNWIEKFKVNGNDVFNLNSFNKNYTELGDPFVIETSKNLKNGNNTVSLTLASAFGKETEYCSQYNKIIYNAKIEMSTSYSPPLEKAEGKNVSIYYDINHDGIADGCKYIAIGDVKDYTPISVNALDPDKDAIDYSLIEILNKLNFYTTEGNFGIAGSETNPIDIELSEINIDSLELSGLRFLWGPSKIKLVVWI